MAEKDAGPTKAKLDKIVKLLGVAKDLHAKQADVLAEIDALLEGKATIAQQLKEAYGIFDRAWCSRYSPEKAGSYFWRQPMDGANMKRLLKRITLDDFAARAVAFINENDAQVTRARHPFSWFVARINHYAQAGSEIVDFELVPNCQHVPPCRSDAAHTRRRTEEQRGSHSGPVGDVL